MYICAAGHQHNVFYFIDDRWFCACNRLVTQEELTELFFLFDFYPRKNNREPLVLKSRYGNRVKL